jgi:hypothetical protein
METPITVSYKPALRDYLMSYYAVLLSSWMLRLTLIFPAFLFISNIFIYIYAILRSGTLKFTPALCFFSIPLPLLLLIFGIVVPYSTQRNLQKNKRLTALTTLSFSAEDIYISNEFSETKMDWGSYQSYYEMKEYYLLVFSVNKRFYTIVAKRAFESATQEKVFKKLIESKIGGGKTLRSPLSSLLIVMIPIIAFSICSVIFIITFILTIGL